MIVIIVLAALAVMALAAIAGTGKFGQWQPTTSDAPKGRLPEGPIDGEFRAKLVIPAAPFGYARQEVDQLLDQIVAGLSIKRPSFTVRPRGYDMAFVDEMLDRHFEPLDAASQATGAPPSNPMPTGGGTSEEESSGAAAEEREATQDIPESEKPDPSEVLAGQEPAREGPHRMSAE